MNNINIYRYHPKRMNEDQFHSIAHDLRLKGEFKQGEEGMVLYNDNQILTWSQPNAKLGGVLYYANRSHSLSGPAGKLPKVDVVREYMNGFLERSHLMPERDKEEVSVKLEARTTEGMIEKGEKGEVRRVPLRVDVSSHIRLGDIPVVGPRAKIRAAFSSARPHFMHIGLWEKVDMYKTGEIIPKERLMQIIEESARRREKKIEFKVQDIKLAYWAGEYQGGADILEPCYFVEIEHIYSERRKDKEGTGPKQVLKFLAYT
jgi:hypothetical protein